MIPLLLSACSTVLQVERTADLGFGFRRVTVAEPSQSSFESVGHFDYLYFGDRRLSQVGAYSISPSGRYAAYQDAPSGDLFLFRSSDRKRIQLSRQCGAPVDVFQWHEEQNSVEALFSGGHGTRAFALR